MADVDRIEVRVTVQVEDKERIYSLAAEYADEKLLQNDETHQDVLKKLVGAVLDKIASDTFVFDDTNHTFRVSRHKVNRVDEEEALIEEDDV